MSSKKSYRDMTIDERADYLEALRAAKKTTAKPAPRPCPRCGTHCYGDCQS